MARRSQRDGWRESRNKYGKISNFALRYVHDFKKEAGSHFAVSLGDQGCQISLKARRLGLRVSSYAVEMSIFSGYDNPLLEAGAVVVNVRSQGENRRRVASQKASCRIRT
jgi:hypothetical protein